MKRKHYDWILVIKDYSKEYPGLLLDFIDFQEHHKRISLNRVARAFVLKRKLMYKLSQYEKGTFQYKQKMVKDSL